MYFVYLLSSKIKSNQIYIGSTNNLVRRLKQHNKGEVFSTKPYSPWKLVYYEAYQNEELAKLREKRLKHHGNAIRELKKRIGL
jgi:putative endonuclease